MKNLKTISKRILCVILAIALLGTCNISAFASANSEASNKSDINGKNYRQYTEFQLPYWSGSTHKSVTAGVTRQNVMHTYLKAGETAYFGSSVYDSRIKDINSNSLAPAPTGNDIVVTKPNGEQMTFDVIQNGKGYIGTKTKVDNGPIISVSDTDSKKYDPCSFTAEASGIYDFMFYSTGSSATVNPGGAVLVENETANQGSGTVAFWDITVANADGEIKTGRTYSNYVALINGSGKYLMNALYYIVTNDGYIYKTELRDLQPYGFVFFSNNQGLTDIGLTASSIYHSVQDNDNEGGLIQNEEYVTFHHPNAPNTELEQTNMIFYEEPSPDLVGVLYNSPPVPQPITKVKFYGYQENKTYYTQGGRFEFECHGSTSVSLRIDFNISINDVLNQAKIDGDKSLENRIANYRNKGGSGIIEINGSVVDGWNSFEWDGYDNNNVHMPTGVYNSSEINVTAEPKAGEIHFPLIDVEGSYKGVTIERLNGIGGRDSANPSDSRFDIYYNNNPLAYGTIEGDPAITGVSPVRDSANTKYFSLSNGTRSYEYNSVGTYFQKMDGKTVNGLTYTVKPKNISTLIPNPNYVKPEDETVDDLGADTQSKFIHQPVDSRNTSITFAIDDDGNAGGGDKAIIDIWTYYGGKVSNTIPFEANLEIVDNVGFGELSGFVFYDDYYNSSIQNKKAPNAEYRTEDGDYPLKDILVRLVDINGNPIQVTSENAELVYFDKSGVSVFESIDGELHYSDNLLYTGSKADLTPAFYEATTDAKGYYSFKGVYYINDDGQPSKDFYVKTYLTETQKSAYTQCTTNNDFNPNKQKAVTLTPDLPIQTFGDIGYTAKNVPLTDLTVMKYWDESIKDPSDSVTVKLYQVNSDTGKSMLYDEKVLSATNGWKYTFINLNKTYKYYVEEYIDDDMGGYDLVGTSEARFIDADNYDSQITSSTTETNDDSGYFVSFSFNPNIIGPTIEMYNKEIIKNYRVVFHSNFTGYSDINSTDYFRIFCRENAIPTVKEHTGFDDVYALNDGTWDIDAFYDIPQRENYVFAGWYYDSNFDKGTKPLKWTTDDYSGDNATDHDGDKYTMTDNNVYHIYAHWIPVGTVTRDADDEKKGDVKDAYYNGFDMLGVQIRDYRLDPNFTYDDGNLKDEWYHLNAVYYNKYGYDMEKGGLRFISVIRNGLLDAVNNVYDVDAENMFYDYEGTKTYSKNEAYQNIEYGHIIASETNWTKFKNNYDGKNGYVYDQLKYNSTNTNGEKTSSKYKYVSNTECTSSVGPNYVDDKNFDAGYKAETSILDHRNYKDYRIMSSVVTYDIGQDNEDAARMKDNVIARPYLRYVDSNGLVRVFYSSYKGESAAGKGCMTSYSSTLSKILEELENVVKA